VEREGLPKSDCELTNYCPRQALKIAVREWLPELYKTVDCNGDRGPKLCGAPTDEGLAITTAVIGE